MTFIIKVLTIVSYDFFPPFCQRMDSAQKSVHFLRPTIHQAKFPLRKNGSVVLKVRAASIEINGIPKGPSPINTSGGVGRPI